MTAINSIVVENHSITGFGGTPGQTTLLEFRGPT
jgi:hypothetical protein